MTQVQPWPIKFQIGARTLFSVRRRLVRVPLELRDVMAGEVPVLPPLPKGADGWSVTSLPEPLIPTVAAAAGIVFVRQRYTRYYTDLTIGFDAWFAGLSGNARSSLKRKRKKLAEVNEGELDIRTYRTAQELAEFHGLARRVAERTYQEKLLGAGLPADVPFRAVMQGKGARGEAFGWLLFVGGSPIAYLYCPMTGGDVRYDYVGHDPSWGEWSPGSVLHMEAFRTLFAEPAALRFDFTEGEGQHKRQFATGGTACVDLLLLRDSRANRAVVAALQAFDGAVERVKRNWGGATFRTLLSRVKRG